MTSNASSQPAFRIFRKADAPHLNDTGAMTMGEMAPITAEGVMRWAGSGLEEGNETRLLFATPQMSLTYAWFKSDFPLPLHSHDADCLYYIIAGSLKLGSETLQAGDDFFVGHDVPYQYRPGPLGVEVLEFRTVDSFDIQFKGTTSAYWDKIVGAMTAARGQWPTEVPPSAPVA